MSMRFTLAPDLAVIVRPGALWLDGATVVERESRLNAPLAAAEAAVRMHPPEEIAAVRTMYKRVGLDPTKTRPSSEALLRRVRRGDPLPRINSMVDVCNWCSLEFQLPYGLYDASHIDGDVELRIGRDGESYPGIRKDDVHHGDHASAAGRLRATRTGRAPPEDGPRRHVEPDERIHWLPGEREAAALKGVGLKMDRVLSTTPTG